MKEKERNKRLIELMVKLNHNEDAEAIELIGSMVANDTPAMQQSYELLTTDNFVSRKLGWVGSQFWKTKE